MNEHEQHVKNWYASACAEARQMQLKTPETPCANCNKPRKEHHYENLKCNLYVTSSNYRAVNQFEVERTNGLISALENLAFVCGWKL
jgi:hypothetical protein